MTQYPTVSRAEIEAGVRRGRHLRSRYLADRAHELTKALIRRLRGREIGDHLADLPDYLLKDIGIERDQIPLLAAGALRRPKTVLAFAACHSPGRAAAPQRPAANDRRRIAA